MHHYSKAKEYFPKIEVKKEIDEEFILNNEEFLEDENFQSQLSCMKKNYDISEMVECEIKEEVYDIEMPKGKDQLNVHDGLKSDNCKFCNKRFRNKSYLKTHIRTVHEGLKEHKCDLCGKGFRGYSYLKIHKTNVHDGVKSLKCDLCG